MGWFWAASSWPSPSVCAAACSIFSDWRGPKAGAPRPAMKLEIRNLTKAFGGVRAIDDVSLTFPSGSLSAVIGPNGARKSTLFNLISGALPADTGEGLPYGPDTIRPPQARRLHPGTGPPLHGAARLPALTGA